MEIQNFEGKLINMTKPEVSDLKHQEMLSDAITNSKDKSVLSWWWLSVPLYMLAALLMKCIYMPHSSLFSNLHNLTGSEKYASILFFLIVPIIFSVLNFISIRTIYFLSGSPKIVDFLLTVWHNVLIIVLSILILIIYTF